MTALVSSYPEAEKLVVEVLNSAFTGLNYYIATVVPSTLPTVSIAVQGLTGKALNVRLDEPVLEVSAITTKHISGDAGYGIADTLAHQFWPALYNARSLRWNNGVITDVKVVSSPHRIQDTNSDMFRFAGIYQLTIHA